MQDSNLPPELSLPEQLQLLSANAEALAKQGRHDDAEKVVLELIKASPRHIPGLQYLASRALARRDFDTAQRYLEKAIRAAPQMAMLHQNLGVVLRARGYLEGALKAFGVALRINPQVGMLWVQLGGVLEALGHEEDALAAYCRSELLIGPLGQAITGARGRNRKALALAATALLRGRMKAISEGTDPIRQRYQPEVLARAEKAVLSLLRAERAEYADPLQRPELSYFPNLEAKPFFEREQFPLLDTLESETEEIGHEFEALLADNRLIRPYVAVNTETDEKWHTLNHSTAWGSYHLYLNGRRVEENCERCPKTLAAIDRLAMPQIPGQSPEVFFSILRPGTHIPPHHGLANYKLTVHLPLIIPAGCAIRVGDETRAWRPGECLIFDDTFEHEAWNKSDSLRAVMILEAWHPGVTEPERALLGEAINALSQFNGRYNELADAVASAAAASR